MTGVDKTPPVFTIDDLLAELRPDDIPDGVTVREMCVKSGWPTTNTNLAKSRRKVTDLVALGSWEYVGEKATATVTGAQRFAPAYRPKGGGDV